MAEVSTKLKAGIVGLGQVGLLFEVDIIGERGRIRVSDNGEKIEYLTFKNDKRSEGYKSLVEEIVPTMGPNSRITDYLIKLWNM